MSEQTDNLRSVINLFTTGLLQILDEQKQRLDAYGIKIARLELDNEQLLSEVKELKEHLIAKQKHFGSIPPATER